MRCLSVQGLNGYRRFPEVSAVGATADDGGKRGKEPRKTNASSVFRHILSLLNMSQAIDSRHARDQNR